MNEIIFIFQFGCIITFSLLCLRLGKEALIAYICILVLAANLFVLKQIKFLGLQATCSDAFAIGSLLSLNLLREFFGKDSAQKATHICFFLMFFFLIISQLHLIYLPSIFDHTQNAYSAIFSSSPRMLFASLAVFFLVQKMDLLIYGWVKKHFPRLNFIVLNYCCLILSQLFDTILFTFLGLYGLIDSVFDVICISFLLKVLIVFCFTPITVLAKKFLPKGYYDTL